MVAFDIAGGQGGAASALLDALRLVDISNNLGDSKSLVTHPATTTHSAPQTRGARRARHRRRAGAPVGRARSRSRSARRSVPSAGSRLAQGLGSDAELSPTSSCLVGRAWVRGASLELMLELWALSSREGEGADRPLAPVGAHGGIGRPVSWVAPWVWAGRSSSPPKPPPTLRTIVFPLRDRADPSTQRRSARLRSGGDQQTAAGVQDGRETGLRTCRTTAGSG